MKTHRIILAVLASVLMAACGPNSKVDFNYAHPERYTAGNATIGQPVSKISVDWYGGIIDIRQADRTDLRIWEESDTTLSDTLRMQHYVDQDGELNIRFCKNGKYHHTLLKRLNKHLTIEVPRGLVLDEIEFNNVSGVVRIDSVQCRQMEANAVNSAVDAAWPIVPDGIEINGVNTTTTLYVPSTAGMTIEMNAVNSDIASELPVRKADKKTILGDGHCEVEINAVNGSLNIKQL